MKNRFEKFNKDGIYYVADIEAEGLSRQSFYNFVKDDCLERVYGGIYADSNALIDELLIINKRCPNAIFSHDESLYYHDLTDREPIKHSITIYTGYSTSRLIKTGIKVYTVKKELLNLGKIEIIDNFGNLIPIYDLERTICDIVRSRNNMDKDEFQSAIKRYALRKDKNLNKLMEYAKMFRVDNVIKTLLWSVL